MAGLFDKDFRLILQRRNTIILFLVIAVIFGFSMGGTFIVGYTTFCFLMLSLGTISYDEFDNGLSFLMTLPISRRTYVAEKYLLCSICGAIAWIFSAVCICINQYKQDFSGIGDLLMEAVMFLPIVILLMSFMIPAQLKYGAEKSRIVLIVVMGSIGVIGIGIKKAAETLDLPMEMLLKKIEGITDVQMLLGCVVFSIAVLLLSFVISMKIMNHKEF